MKPSLKLVYDVDGNLSQVIGQCKAKEFIKQFEELKKVVKNES